MVVNQGQLSPHLIKERTSIGLKRHQENIQIKKLQIFFLQTLLQRPPRNFWIGEIINRKKLRRLDEKTAEVDLLVQQSGIAMEEIKYSTARRDIHSY